MQRFLALALLVLATLSASVALAAVKPVTGIRSISLGAFDQYDGCAITSGGALQCFGSIAGKIAAAQSGDGKQAFIQLFASGVSAVSVGGTHACAIVDGALLCWGDNHSGQIGTGKKEDFVATPARIFGNGVSAVSAGRSSTCAIVNTALWCWGGNHMGQVGNGSISDAVATPVQVIPGGVTAVSAGSQHTCAAVNGALKCWGYLAQPGSFEPTLSKVELIASGVTAVSASKHTCAIANGALLCWGRDVFGEVGVGNEPKDKPKVVLNSGVTAVTVSPYNSCAIAQGALYCWGANTRGQLGLGMHPPAHTPQKVIARGVTAVSVSEFQTCAVVDGVLQCTDGGVVMGNNAPPASWGLFTANRTPLTIIIPEPEPPRYYGLWRGTIGKMEVMALLGKDPCQASYYYLRHQTAIPLLGEDKSGLVWAEGQNGSTGSWALEHSADGKLTGTWTSADGKRHVPIRLSPVDVQGDSNDECSGQVAAYDAPRIERVMKNLSVTESKAGPLPHNVVAVPGESLSTFEVLPGKFNVPRLNKALRDGLQGELASHYSCIDQDGRGSGEYDVSTAPTSVVAGHVLTFTTYYNAYCGGAHPDAWSSAGLWDLETDQAVTPRNWIRYEKSRYGGVSVLPDKLIDVIYATATAEPGDDECTDSLKEYAADSELSIGDTGMIFRIHYPHVIQACDQDITVPYSKLTPFLTAEGKRAISALAQRAGKR